jgi:putative ABC transport system permease protein
MQDLRDAVRSLCRNPLLSAAAILSLALGIGANTAIFSILNSLLLKPLPVRDPQTLVALASNRAGEDAAMTYPVWRAIRDRHVLPDLFVWATDRVTVVVGGNSQPVEAIWASGRFFDVLGLTMNAGRTFGDGDDRRGAGPGGPVAVLSYNAATGLFGTPAASIGRTLVIERMPFTVVGVTRRGFNGLNIGSDVDVIVPLETEPMLNRVPSRTTRWPWLHITARLAPGMTLAAATAAMRAAQPGIRDATLPDFSHAEDRDNYLREPWTMRSAATGSSRLRSRYQSALMTLFAIAGLVLLVACVNIAHLQLARTASRRYDHGVRLALGAPRSRIAWLELLQSFLLAALGAAVGLAVAQWAGAVVVAQLSTWASTPSLDLTPDWRVLAVTIVATVLTTVLFGTVPAIRAARVDPIEALNTARRGVAAPALGTGGDALVVAQIALSLLLIIGAALFVRSFVALAYRDLGFDRNRVLTAVVDVGSSPTGPADRPALYERIREAVASVPGVESAATSMATPLGSAGIRFLRDVQESGNPTFDGKDVRILMAPVSPDWFRTFGTRLISGRDIAATDRAAAPNVAVINEAFARRHFPGSNPLGRTIMVGEEPTDRRPVEIVGVVEDAAFTSVRDPIEPTLYMAFAQALEPQLITSFPSMSLSIRSVGGMPPVRLASGVAAAIARVDGAATVSFQTLTETLSIYYIRERLLALLSGYFGGFALLLGAIGVYGVTAHAVNRRRTEIGIRMAIGAGAPAVVRLVVSRVVVLATMGVVLGCLLSLWGSRLIQALLFDTEFRDPSVLATSILALLLVTVLAAWMPARRASRIEPAIVLREG